MGFYWVNEAHKLLLIDDVYSKLPVGIFVLLKDYKYVQKRQVKMTEFFNGIVLRTQVPLVWCNMHEIGQIKG